MRRPSVHASSAAPAAPRRTGRTVAGLPAPARYDSLRYATMIENSSDHEIDKRIDVSRPVVESRCSRKYHRASPGHSEHVLEVHNAERGLAWNKNEPPTLLERDVRRTFDQ